MLSTLALKSKDKSHSICKLIVLTTAIVSMSLMGSHANAKVADILIKNGMIYDGTGNSPYQGDVVISGNKIISVGKSKNIKAATVIDAKGMAVSPGFIDPHTHIPQSIIDLDGKFLSEQDIRQGVTTVIFGPDGDYSPRELREFFAAAETKGTSQNYSCYVGHNGVRKDVMGVEQRTPTAEENEQMKALVREGMEMGCVGLSAGLMYEPGMFSPPDEIVMLAKEVKPYDGIYDSHSREPVKEFLASEIETAEIGIKAGIPANLGHVKAVGLLNKDKAQELIAKVEELHAAGYRITGDVYPYDGAATTVLSDILIFPNRAPSESRSHEETKVLLKAALGNSAEKAKIKDLTENGLDGGFSWIKAVDYGSIRIVDAPGQPELMDKYIVLLAQERGQDPFDTMIDIIMNASERIIVTLGAIMNNDLHALLKAPWTMVSSDGSHLQDETALHPRSTGSFARVLGYYSREMKLFTMEEAIRKMTSFTADTLRLYDRGRLEAGKNADVVIFDPNTIIDKSTYVEPRKLAVGVRDVIVNGQFVLRDGNMTSSVPGKFVKRQNKP